MNNMHKHEERFYGSTTVGERGQVVIPAEARTALKLSQGEKLLVLGLGEGMIVLAKLEHVEKIAAHLTNRLKSVKDILGQSKSK